MDLENIKSKLEKSIGSGLYKHCLRTAEEAFKLAEHYKENSDKAYIAGILHDCGKNKSSHNDNLLHSVIGAELAKTEYGIVDEDIINSIKYHTTGRENMSMLEKIIFIADKIEPHRKYEGIHEIRKLAYYNINKSIIESLKSTIDYVKQRGFELDDQSVKTLDYLSNGGN